MRNKMHLQLPIQRQKKALVIERCRERRHTDEEEFIASPRRTNTETPRRGAARVTDVAVVGGSEEETSAAIKVMKLRLRVK